MSIIKSEDSGKWITGLVALVSVVSGFLFKKFVDQMSIWLDLEAKVPNMALLSQAVGVIVGFGVFIYILKNFKTSSYLNEVYEELVRVVWPTKDATIKITIGLVVALVIVAGIFVSVDFVFKKILSIVY
jgi:preprotein translocase SecE subunit